jgi:hypothetical protein
MTIYVHTEHIPDAKKDFKKSVASNQTAHLEVKKVRVNPATLLKRVSEQLKEAHII